MKNILKKIVPRAIFTIYHWMLAVCASWRYGYPSRKMIVIGVTGTKGKTSTINFIWSCLQAGGFKTGIISTANIRIGDTESMNEYHMTMPGRFAIQKLMSEMVKAGCKYCIVETTSEGINQYRHVGIDYDIAVFTNLSPEHLPSHAGSFENYKAAKLKMFRALESHEKTLGGKIVEKVIIANKDNEHADYYLAAIADRKVTFAIDNSADFIGCNILETDVGVNFEVMSHPLTGAQTEIQKAAFGLGILGRFNVYNALPAIVIARLAGIGDEQIRNGLSSLAKIPGRMEKIEAGQNFTVIVDYAHEKQSMTGVLMTANNLKPIGAKTIVLLGAEGGGRDKSKRPIMGELAGEMADYVIVSNVDPYDDDPKEILEDIAVAAEGAGKIRGENLFVIEDRREGIRKALSLGKAGDIVLITGKGAEQSMVMADGKKIPWDDRTVVREELAML